VRLRSKGLGRKELVMDFREYEIVREGDEIVVVGTIRDPVNWDFTIRVCEDDLAGLLRLGTHRSFLGMILGSLFKRKPKHHWTQDRDEHVAEGKRRLADAKENAQERAHAALQSTTLTVRRTEQPEQVAATGT
jgi:hypothetical protein